MANINLIMLARFEGLVCQGIVVLFPRLSRFVATMIILSAGNRIQHVRDIIIMVVFEIGDPPKLVMYFSKCSEISVTRQMAFDFDPGLCIRKALRVSRCASSAHHRPFGRIRFLGLSFDLAASSSCVAFRARRLDEMKRQVSIIRETLEFVETSS